MRRLLSSALTVLGLFGLVTPDSIASSRVWRGIDRYANQRKIPPEVMFTVGYYDVSSIYDSRSIYSLADYYMIHNLGGTLLLLGSNDRYYSYLAKWWEVDTPGKAITFTLQDDLKFSDGSPLTAMDVALTFRRLLLTGSTHLSLKILLQDAEQVKDLSSPFSGIEVRDEKRVTFRFTHMSNLLFFLFTQPDGVILSPGQIDKASLAVAHWKITSGAYAMTSTGKGENVLKANPHFVFFDKEMLQEIRIARMENDEQVRALAAGSIQYTFHSSFTSPEEYETLRRSGKVDILPKNLCATSMITINKDLPIFRKKRVRQAVFRHLKNHLDDIRPLKDDRYFVNTHQFIMPTQIGVVSDVQYADSIKNFPPSLDKLSGDYPLVKYPWFVSTTVHDRIASIFRNLGITVRETNFSEIPVNEILKMANASLFSTLPMFGDEKEVYDAIEYLDRMKRFFADNRDTIMESNRKLSETDDKAVKVACMKEINRLIIDDAVMIPFYHIVHQTIISKDYEVTQVNEFSSAPRLWNIRIKLARGGPAGK